MSAHHVIDNPGARKADLAAIHIAKAELGWDDDCYRDILFTVCRVRSSALLDHAGRKRFLAHLRACGWSGGVTPRRGPARPATAPKRPALTRPQRLIWSLWQQLFEAGVVTDRRMPALLHFIERQTGVARLEWLNSAQEDLVIQSLKAWRKRTGGG
ncbi:MAG: regulatory protein GemA [Ideonella sp.]|nr:regulatory protein GemA [Ideonella sp.]MCC7455950.1 regulatory protein GemA [Nitrospira sp.]